MGEIHPAIADLRKELEEAEKWLTEALLRLRAGAATPAALDAVRVEAYGERLPLTHVASITVEGPRTLRVSVWDTALIRAVATAIRESDLGFAVVEDEAGVRATLPELTSERREHVIRQVRAALEEARVRIRRARDEAKEAIVRAAREGSLAEDDKFRLLKKMQELVDIANKALEARAEVKEAELRAV